MSTKTRRVNAALAEFERENRPHGQRHGGRAEDVRQRRYYTGQFERSWFEHIWDDIKVKNEERATRRIIKRGSSNERADA